MFISFVLDNVHFNHIRPYYGKLPKFDERNCFLNYDLKSKKSFKFKENPYIYEKNFDEKNFDFERITTILFICNDITFDQIMNKNFFYDFYLSDAFHIQLKQFINSSQYSIGYSVSQKMKKDEYPFKPILTYRLTNTFYDQNNIFVSTICKCMPGINLS